MEKQGKYTLFETLSALSGNYRIRVLSLGWVEKEKVPKY